MFILPVTSIAVLFCFSSESFIAHIGRFYDLHVHEELSAAHYLSLGIVESSVVGQGHEGDLTWRDDRCAEVSGGAATGGVSPADGQQAFTNICDHEFFLNHISRTHTSKVWEDSGITIFGCGSLLGKKGTIAKLGPPISWTASRR